MSQFYTQDKVLTSITVPANYLRYLKRILPATEHRSLTANILHLLMQEFPPPDDPKEEDSAVQNFLNNVPHPPKEILIRDLPAIEAQIRNTKKTFKIAKVKIKKRSAIMPSVPEYEDTLLPEDEPKICMRALTSNKHHTISVYSYNEALEKLGSKLCEISWEKKNFGYNREFLDEQARGFWTINYKEILSHFGVEKEDFLNAFILGGLGFVED